jgi:hypothetical protein
MVAGRMRDYAPKEKVPNGIDYELKRLYYDIAGTVYPPAIAALASLVPTTQILFGSDNPFVPLAKTAEGMMQLGFSADDRRRIGRDNALALMPRLMLAAPQGPARSEQMLTVVRNRPNIPANGYSVPTYRADDLPLPHFAQDRRWGDGCGVRSRRPKARSPRRPEIPSRRTGE